MKAQAASPEASLTREEEQAEVIRRLEEDIIFGRFAPGSRLVEDSLMGRYGASRHFIRQALFQLERQGIVLREKNIGATVRFYSADEVRQIYEVREMLTRQAALMIPLPAPKSLIEQLAELQRHYCERADAQDLRGIHEANDAFHVALFSACGNPYLVSSLRDYMNLTLPMRAKNLADQEGLAQSRRQHELMIELLRGRDSWAFAQLCVDHMQYSKSDYLGRIARDERSPLALAPVHDPTLVAIELHAAECAALVEVADGIGWQFCLLRHGVLAKIFGTAGRAVAEIVGAVVVPPSALVVGGAVENLEFDVGMIEPDAAQLHQIFRLEPDREPAVIERHFAEIADPKTSHTEPVLVGIERAERFTEHLADAVAAVGARSQLPSTE